jgi:hypothetical protein
MVRIARVYQAVILVLGAMVGLLPVSPILHGALLTFGVAVLVALNSEIGRLRRRVVQLEAARRKKRTGPLA